MIILLFSLFTNEVSRCSMPNAYHPQIFYLFYFALPETSWNFPWAVLNLLVWVERILLQGIELYLLKFQKHIFHLVAQGHTSDCTRNELEMISICRPWFQIYAQSRNFISPSSCFDDSAVLCTSPEVEVN